MADDSIPDINEILGNAVVVELDKISTRTLSKIKAIWLRYKYLMFDIFSLTPRRILL